MKTVRVGGEISGSWQVSEGIPVKKVTEGGLFIYGQDGVTGVTSDVCTDVQSRSRMRKGRERSER